MPQVDESRSESHRPPTPADAGESATAVPHDPHAAGLVAWPRAGSLMLSALLGAVCGTAGSYVFTRVSARPAADTPVAVVPDRTGQTVTAGPADDLPARVDRLSEQVDRLQKQAADRPRDESPPGVSSLQVRVADLTTATDNLASLPGKVDRLGNRISELSRTLELLRGDVDSLQTRTGNPPPVTAPARQPADQARGGVRPTRLPDRPGGEVPMPIPPPAAPVTRTSRRSVPTGPSLAKGAELFRRGRYKDALEQLTRAELDQPDDARVWYYAALCNGFSTNDWSEGTVDLVEKGVAREEAGTPGPSVIDDEFKDLTSATGKDWLAAYRRRARSRRGG